MINHKADEVLKELFDSLKNRKQNNLESMKDSEFVFDYVHLLYDKRHEINPSRNGSYMDSPNWIKNQKTTINLLIKKNNKCFQYAVIIGLNHEKMEKDPQRIRKTKPFINRYNWEGRNFPSEKYEWKKFVKNKIIFTLNVLYVEKEKYILLMVQNVTQTVEKKLFF